MIKFLLALKTNRKNIKILIPSILDDLIFNLCDKQRLGGIVEIFHGWLPTIPEEFIEEIILDLCRDEKFMDLNKSLLEFKPQKIAEDEKRFTKQGENRELIPKEEAVRILGENTGSIIYEILQISMRGEAKVLGVGNETIRMLERLWKKVEINSLSDDYDLHTMCLTYNSIFNNFRVSEIWEDINP